MWKNILTKILLKRKNKDRINEKKRISSKVVISISEKSFIKITLITSKKNKPKIVSLNSGVKIFLKDINKL